MGNALQHQNIRVIVRAIEGKHQPVTDIQPGAVQIVPDFLDVRRTKFANLNKLLQLLEVGDTLRVELVVQNDLHRYEIHLV